MKEIKGIKVESYVQLYNLIKDTVNKVIEDMPDYLDALSLIVDRIKEEHELSSKLNELKNNREFCDFKEIYQKVKDIVIFGSDRGYFDKKENNLRVYRMLKESCKYTDQQLQEFMRLRKNELSIQKEYDDCCEKTKNISKRIQQYKLPYFENDYVWDRECNEWKVIKNADIINNLFNRANEVEFNAQWCVANAFRFGGPLNLLIDNFVKKGMIKTDGQVEMSILDNNRICLPITDLNLKELQIFYYDPNKQNKEIDINDYLKQMIDIRSVDMITMGETVLSFNKLLDLNNMDKIKSLQKAIETKDIWKPIVDVYLASCEQVCKALDETSDIGEDGKDNGPKFNYQSESQVLLSDNVDESGAGRILC